MKSIKLHKALRPYKKQIIKLYKELNYIVDDANEDYLKGYLMITEGNSGKLYLWYLDAIQEAAIEIETSTIIDNNEIEREFNR